MCVRSEGKVKESNFGQKHFGDKVGEMNTLIWVQVYYTWLRQWTVGNRNNILKRMCRMRNKYLLPWEIYSVLVVVWRRSFFFFDISLQYFPRIGKWSNNHNFIWKSNSNDGSGKLHIWNIFALKRILEKCDILRRMWNFFSFFFFEYFLFFL